ncbi:MAG: hypothetical protein AAF725_27985, partial [Acidobacteriota bacterium]
MSGEFRPDASQPTMRMALARLLSRSGAPLPALAIALMVFTGCAGSSISLLPGSSRTPEVEPMWRLPADAYPTQRLYRANYQGEEGKLGFKLTLYLADAERYRMEAADTLGRKVWSLDYDPATRATFLDHRQELYCTSTGGGRQTFVPIAHLPLAALPRLILGRMPGEPEGEVAEAEGKISYVDARGQRWNGLAENGALSWWSLILDGEAVAWWRRGERRFIFSDRRGGQQVTWREQVSEALGRPREPLVVPPAYPKGVCDQSV